MVLIFWQPVTLRIGRNSSPKTVLSASTMTREYCKYWKQQLHLVHNSLITVLELLCQTRGRKAVLDVKAKMDQLQQIKLKSANEMYPVRFLAL